MTEEYIVRILENDDCITEGVLVRCMDCKFWGADGYRNGCKYATCIMMENDYCSMAERRTDETD